MRPGLLVLLVACGSTPDPAATDAAPADTPTDTPIDAPVDLCPNRTAGVGEPQNQVPAAQIQQGDVTIRNALDVQALAGKRVITGNLVFEQAPTAEVELPDLEVVGNEIRITGDPTANDLGALERIRLPALETVGVGITVALRGNVLPGFFAPNLESLQNATLRAAELDIRCLKTGGLFISAFEGASLDLPKFEGPLLRASQLANATSISLPKLTDDLTVEAAPALTTITAPSLAAGVLALTDNAALASVAIHPNADLERLDLINLPALSSLDLTGVTLHGFQLIELPQLASFAPRFSPTLLGVTILKTAITNVDLAGVTTVFVHVGLEENLALLTFTADALTSIDNFGSNAMAVTDNPLLPTCYATRIRDQLPTGTPVVISGNGTGTCP